MGNIATLADVKTRLGLNDTDYDSIITAILDGIDSIFDSFTGRTLIAPASAVTEYHGGCGDFLQLKNYPVIAITSIKESWDYSFDSVDALTADTDYRVINGGKNGILMRRYINWMSEPDSIQVVYRAGFCAAGEAAGDGETALPGDLREAAIEQASLIFKRRDDIGLSAQGFDGGSINKFSQIKLLPNVEQILLNYRRPQL